MRGGGGGGATVWRAPCSAVLERSRRVYAAGRTGRGAQMREGEK